MSSAPSRSSPDGFDAALDAAAVRILGLVGPLPHPVVLIDGRSGSGKTTLAARLAERWEAPIDVVALDDLYPGWDGLERGVATVHDRLLVPRGLGERAVWQRWDWDLGGYAEEHDVRADRPLIVEGSGILTRATAELADVTVWLESPDAARRHRALARDGELYRPHWDRWALQEERHLAHDRPAELATVRADIP